MGANSNTDGVNFTVKLDPANGQAVARALIGMQLRMQDLRPVLRDIGAAMLTSTQRRFEDEQGPDGAGWEATLRGGAILRDTGRLYQSLTYAASAHQVEIGTNTVYARIHQLGGQTGRGHALTLPARPFLGMDAEDETEALAIVQDYIRGVLP